MFKILSKTTNGVKGAVTASLTGVTDVAGTIINVVKKITVTTIKDSGSFIREGIQLPASIVKGAIDGITEIGTSFIKAIKGIIEGAVEGAMESGAKPNDAIGGAVSQAMYMAKDLGEDVGETAIAAVTGAVEGVTKTGGDGIKATAMAVKTALSVAEDIGEEVLTQVKDSLNKSVKGAKEIIKEVEIKK